MDTEKERWARKTCWSIILTPLFSFVSLMLSGFMASVLELFLKWSTSLLSLTFLIILQFNVCKKISKQIACGWNIEIPRSMVQVIFSMNDVILCLVLFFLNSQQCPPVLPRWVWVKPRFQSILVCLHRTMTMLPPSPTDSPTQMAA